MLDWAPGSASSHAVDSLSFCCMLQTGRAFLSLTPSRCFLRAARVRVSSWVVMAILEEPSVLQSPAASTGWPRTPPSSSSSVKLLIWRALSCNLDQAALSSTPVLDLELSNGCHLFITPSASPARCAKGVRLMYSNMLMYFSVCQLFNFCVFWYYLIIKLNAPHVLSNRLNILQFVITFDPSNQPYAVCVCVCVCFVSV